MGNFEKLSVLVIVVIIVMILVVAIYTWTDNPDQSATTGTNAGGGGTADVVDVNKSGTFGGGETPPGPDWTKIFEEEEKAGGSGLEPIGKTPEPDPVIVPPVKPDPDPVPKPEPKEPTPSSGPWMYTVQGGDTLSEIAMRELGSMRLQSKIMALNPGLDPNSLRIGQQIKMPPKSDGTNAGGVVSEDPPKVVAGSSAKPTPGEHYVTRSGDTLERIAKRAYGTIEYWGEIWASNLKTLETPGDIRAGMKLFIPKVNRYARPN